MTWMKWDGPKVLRSRINEEFHSGIPRKFQLMVHTPGSPLPSEKHELLLRASLLSGDSMLTAFQQWKRKVDFEIDVDHASLRLLPLLYMNLHTQGVEDPLMPRLKGIYRNSWSKNQLLFFKAGKIVQFFNEHGIPNILMKGIPLSVLVYRNFAVRPMADIDVLIPYEQAGPTVELLKSSGWKLYEPQYFDYALKYGRSATFADGDNTELDLHWHPVFEVHAEIREDDFRALAVPFKVSGAETKSFCPTDQLFHTIIHGFRTNPEPPVRWIADAVTLISTCGMEIDWDRLTSQTANFRVHLQMREALNYLVKVFDADIPDRVIAALNAMKSSSANRVVYRHAMKIGDMVPETMYQKLFSIYAGFLRQTSETGIWRQHVEFVRFMRFRTKGKPYFRILIYYFSLMIKRKR